MKIKINDLIYNLPTDDQDTWDTICKGDTKGIFQLESYLCQHWSKESKPRSIEELSDLISIVRPGTLESKLTDENGKVKSLTQVYCDRKHKRDLVSFQHPDLETILGPTNGIMIFQEQAILIVQKLAGFDLAQADIVRKAIGTKNPEIMSSLRSSFLEGCKKTDKVTEEIANEIFDNIKNSQRYLFNKSHSVSYSYISYWTAYLKTHYPLEFYTEYLNNAKDKPKPKIEIKELVTDAQRHDINVRMTHLSDIKEDGIVDFYHKNGEILFGLQHVKQIGKLHIKSLMKTLSKNPSWIDILEANLQKQTMINLTSVGFFDEYGISRKDMLHQYTIYNKLSSREISLTLECKGTLQEKFKFILDKVNINRRVIIQDLIKALDHPPYSLIDDPTWRYDVENEMLGICLDFHKTDISDEIANATCKEINDGKQNECTLILEITEPKEYKIKQGKSKGEMMGSFNASDNTGEIKCMVFSEVWTENRHKLYPGAVIFVMGYPGKKGGFVISKIK